MARFFFSHFWVTPFGFIMQTMLVIAIIWFPKSRHPGKAYESKYIKAVRGFPMALLFFFGVIFVDIFVELVLLGAYGYVSAAQFMPSAIIAGVIGIQCVIMVMLVNPNRKSLGTTSAYVAAYIIFMKAVVPASQDIWLAVWGFAIMGILGLVHMLLIVFEAVIKKMRPSFKGDGELWNIQAPFKRIFSPPVVVATWIVLVVELFLQATGFSILTVFTAVA